MNRLLVIAIGLLGSVLGCAPLPVFDGGRLLAHPTMTPDEVASPFEGRVRTISEGAVGGVSSVSSNH